MDVAAENDELGGTNDVDPVRRPTLGIVETKDLGHAASASADACDLDDCSSRQA